MNNAPPLSNSPQQAYTSLSERPTDKYEQLPDIQPDALSLPRLRRQLCVTSLFFLTHQSTISFTRRPMILAHCQRPMSCQTRLQLQSLRVLSHHQLLSLQ